MMPLSSQDNLFDIIRNNRKYIDPDYKPFTSQDDFQFSTEVGHAARIISQESADLQHAIQQKSTELIGFATVISKDQLHLRGSLMSSEVDITVSLPSDWKDKKLPADNQYVKCYVTWEKTGGIESTTKSDDWFKKIPRFSDRYIPLLDNWMYQERVKTFDYPFGPDEFDEMVWESLDASINLNQNYSDLGLASLQSLMLSNAISTPPIKTERGGLLSQVVAPSQLQRQTSDLIRKIHKLFPDQPLKIKHGEHEKEISYFTFDHTVKTEQSEQYYESRQVPVYDEVSMNYRYNHTSKLRFNGELNFILPFSLSVSKDDEQLRKYYDYIQLFTFIARSNAPIIELSTDETEFIQSLVQRSIIDQVDDDYIGTGKLVDTERITMQVQRIVLSEARKLGRDAIDKSLITYKIDELERMIRASINEIETSPLQKAMRSKPTKTKSYSVEENIILQSYKMIDNSYPKVEEQHLLSEAERNSSLSQSQVEKTYADMRRGGVFMRSKDEYNSWVVKMIE